VVDSLLPIDAVAVQARTAVVKSPMLVAARCKSPAKPAALIEQLNAYTMFLQDLCTAQAA
jgi:hypothetical protein